MDGNEEDVVVEEQQDAPETDGGADQGDDSLPDLATLDEGTRGLVEKFKKSFQSDYTKKRKEESEKLTKAEEKAAALDRLMTDPDYAQRFMAAMQAGQRPDQQGSQDEPWMKLDPASFFNEENVGHINAAAYGVLKKFGGPAMAKVGQIEKILVEQVLPFIKAQGEKSQGSEWAGIEKKFANAKEFKEEAMVLLQKTNGALTIEQALRAVAGQSLKALGPAAKQPENKRQANLFNGTGRGDLRAQGKKSLTELIEEEFK